MKKWIVIILVLAAACAAGWTWRIWWPGNQEAQAGNRGALGLVERRDIRFTVSVAGEIGPAEQVSVRPEVNGRISELPVDVGDKVKRGDLLFALDDRDLQIEVGSRDTEIASAKLQLERAQRDYERDRLLFEQNLVSREVFENSKTEYELARNNIQKADKALELAKDRLSKTRIVAPFDCTVLTRPVSAGQAVSGSGGFNSGTEVLTIADLHEMIINAHVNQVDVTRLKPDMEVDVQVEAVADLKVKGRVERIAPQATIRNSIKGFAVRIRLRDVDAQVQPGMTANISIPVESADDVLAVPLAGVFTEIDPETGAKSQHAFVRKNGKFERRPIRIGISDYFYAEVLAGLNAGEEVSLEQPAEGLILEAASAAESPAREARPEPGVRRAGST